MTLRVVSYNILNGGIGRADPLAEVLLAQKPDIVCLVEADDADVRDRIAWRLGFDQVAAVGRESRTSCLMTRGTITTSINLADKTSPRSLLLCDLLIDERDIGVAVAHLSGRASDDRETRREREADTLLAATQPWRKSHVPHLLAGDFNSTSPQQELGDVPPKVLPHFKANGDAIPRRVISKLLDAGYADSFTGDAARTQTTFTTQHPGLRLDYIFTHGLDALSCRVETDRLARAASDHFPVTAEVA